MSEDGERFVASMRKSRGGGGHDLWEKTPEDPHDLSACAKHDTWMELDGLTVRGHFGAARL